jgi:hypothetical protein
MPIVAGRGAVGVDVLDGLCEAAEASAQGCKRASIVVDFVRGGQASRAPARPSLKLDDRAARSSVTATPDQTSVLEIGPNDRRIDAKRLDEHLLADGPRPEMLERAARAREPERRCGLLDPAARPRAARSAGSTAPPWASDRSQPLRSSGLQIDL